MAKASKGRAMTQENNYAVSERKRTSPKLGITTDENGVYQIDCEGDLEPLLRASGNVNVAHGLLMQMAALGSHGNRIDENATNFALGFVDSMKPKDATEVLLVSQMAAIHQATMMLARRLNHVENIPQQDAAERALNKLARTFAAQVDTLKRYRSKGQQTVRVERVTVQEGGQAIVGNVQRGCPK
ncbi:hypothetical protein LZG00_09250 [Rhodobacteraceae bacterium LMO-12]|nr:hypothetical protein [Rhodobacteraceae bacterium LMO-JJ12]